MKTNKTLFAAALILLTFLASNSHAELSHGPRQTGEIMLKELVMGTNKFMALVASNGCTFKGSFKVDVKKKAGASPESPQYDLTILRIAPDECKAIVDGGTLILFDLEKDLGIKSPFTYSVLNRVYSSSGDESPDQSLLSILEKHFAFNFPQIKEIRPEPYTKFVMDHDYFTCLIPAKWELQRDKGGDEKAGIFEIRLTKPDKAKEEDGEKYLFPDPIIYVGYYSKNNDQKKTYENYVKDYDNLMQEHKGSERSTYEKPQNITFSGRDAVVQSYEVYQEFPRGPFFSIKYFLKAKFIIVRAEDGFYVIAYKSPKEFYDKYLPVFEEVAKSFQVKK